jgi:hypothetical protein
VYFQLVTAPSSGRAIANIATLTAARPDDVVSGHNSTTLNTSVACPALVPGIPTSGLGVLALMLGAAVFVMRRRRAAAL